VKKKNSLSALQRGSRFAETTVMQKDKEGPLPSSAVMNGGVFLRYKARVVQ